MFENGISPRWDPGSNAISEFAEKLLEWIIKSLYDPLYESVEKSFQGLFDSLDNNVTNATQLISAGPEQWNGSAFGLMQTVAENVCIPIAGAFITVIFCWEMIHLVQDSNSMQSVKPENLMISLMKFALCLMVCAYSFKIIMGFCDLGIWAVGRLGTGSNVSFGASAPGLADLGISNPPDDGYTVGGLMELVGYKIILVIAKVGIVLCGLLVYVRVMLWFMELLLYASAASIPYSTWMNREWSQVGMNYTRKMLALSFEGFFMLLLFAMYGGVLGGMQLGDFMQSLVMIIGCGFALAVMMFKVGNISSSIFNAH